MHEWSVLPLSDHAKFEMERREIPEKAVEMVFEGPEQKIMLTSGREIWQNKIIMEGKEYVLRLIMETQPELKIITVYRSSKIKKYWRPA